jgi:hypothetical protein
VVNGYEPVSRAQPVTLAALDAGLMFDRLFRVFAGRCSLFAVRIELDDAWGWTTT